MRVAATHFNSIGQRATQAWRGKGGVAVVLWMIVVALLALPVVLLGLVALGVFAVVWAAHLAVADVRRRLPRWLSRGDGRENVRVLRRK